MNVTPSQVIRNLLITAGLANLPSVTGDWPITVGTMPSGKDVSDTYIMIRGTGGWVEDGRNQKTGEDFRHPTMQLMFRSNSHSEAELKGRNIEEFLTNVKRVDIIYGGHVVTVESVIIVTPTAYLKQEEQNQRQLYVMNIRTTLTEVS